MFHMGESYARLVIDMASGETIRAGLTMLCSPHPDDGPPWPPRSRTGGPAIDGRTAGSGFPVPPPGLRAASRSRHRPSGH
ncbi:hypothetical protein [Azospirillum argentinense]